MKKNVSGLVVGIVAGLFLAGAALAGQASLGQRVYKSKCAICHGKSGRADTRAGRMMKTPDLSDRANWKYGTSQAQVEKIVREGKGKMKPFKAKLKAGEIQAVARYMRELCAVDGK